MENKNILTIILSVALVVAIIFVIIGFVDNSSSQSQVATLQTQNTNLQTQLQTVSLNISNPANAFDTKLHDLLQEHTFLLAAVGRQAINSSASFNAVVGALQNNINEVGTLLIPIYGSNSSELVALWNQKANIYINYSNSLKNGDPNALAYYNAAEAVYQPQVVAFWTSTNNPYPILSQTTAQQLVSNNAADMKTTIDDWYAGNYVQYYQDLETAYVQAGVYADVIANGIIQQNPQDFNEK